MGSVYRVGSIYGTHYFNTKKDAFRCMPGGEFPESFTYQDAAETCNKLEKQLDEMESKLRSARLLLEELFDACPDDIAKGTSVGHRVSQFIDKNPLSATTAADRDGQRSYGNG